MSAPAQTGKAYGVKVPYNKRSSEPCMSPSHAS